MKLVCITGIDGTGKSTLARGVVETLRGQDRDVVYSYGRAYPIISRAVMAAGRVVALRGKDPWRDYQDYDASKKSTLKNRWLATGYTLSILCDYFVQLWVKLLLTMRPNRLVVLDRYVYDTVISDLAVHLNYSERAVQRAIDLCLKLLPKPQLTLLLDVPAEVAYARKDDVPHVEYLRERQRWYRALETRAEVTAASGERPPEELVQLLIARMAAVGVITQKGSGEVV